MGGSWFAHGADETRELSFLFCGRQNYQPGEIVGPAVREHYLLSLGPGDIPGPGNKV